MDRFGLGGRKVLGGAVPRPGLFVRDIALRCLWDLSLLFFPFRGEPSMTHRKPWTEEEQELFEQGLVMTIIYRGYYMAARRYEISLRVLTNISRVSAANEWNIFQHEKRNFVSPSGHVMFYLLYKHQWNAKPFNFNILLLRRRDVSCSHSNRVIFTCEDNMLFSRVKISCFRAKAHLVFHWCLYNK